MKERKENHSHRFDFVWSMFGFIGWKCSVCGKYIEELEDATP